MLDPYRHSIAELVTRYELEPSLRDIYVEGPRDQFFLKWFFHRVGGHHVVAYPVEVSVDVPAETLAQCGLDGNRGRVIALCLELGAALRSAAGNVAGLVDKDYSEILGTKEISRLLFHTDYSSMECYALSEQAIHKFCYVYLGVAIPHARFDEMFQILTELFLLRAAKILLARPASWIDTFTRLCSIRGGRIAFDRSEFVRRLANASRGTITLAELEAAALTLRGRLADDFRQHINSHDLIQILSWYAHQIGVGRAIYNAAPLQRGLMTSVELEDLQKASLFQQLALWSFVQT